MEPQHTIDATLAATGSKATYTGASMAVGSWFLSSEFGVFCGVVIGLAGLIVNFYFKHREDKRKQLEHEIRVQNLREDQHE